MTREEIFNLIYPFGQPSQLTETQVYGMVDKLISKGLILAQSPEDEVLSFILSDFEFLHSGHYDRMKRVKRFLDMVGMKLVRK